MGMVMDIYLIVFFVVGVKFVFNYILDGVDLRKLLKGKRDKKYCDDFLMYFLYEYCGSYFIFYCKGDWKFIYYYNL